MPCDQSQDHVMSYKEDSRPRATRQSRVLSASRVLSGQEESTHRKNLHIGRLYTSEDST